MRILYFLDNIDIYSCSTTKLFNRELCMHVCREAVCVCYSIKLSLAVQIM